MTTWDEIYRAVHEAYKETKASPLFFRGHADAKWTLTPALARTAQQIALHTKLPSPAHVEENLYFEFVTNAGDLLPEPSDSWEHLFAMQHHGVPTRLLDWTECFAVALHFALKGAVGPAAIWILDPFALNRAALGAAKIVRPNYLGSYYDMYIGQTARVPKKATAAALYPLRHNQRVFQQKAGFTLHHDLAKPLDALFPRALRKIVLPESTHADARTFLLLAGVSEFTLFPDLDALSRQMRQRYLGASEPA